MSTVSYKQTHFGSMDVVPLVNLTAHAGEAYRNKTQEDKLRQQILNDLQNQRPDLFTPTSKLTQTVLNQPQSYQPPAVVTLPPASVHFGMLGAGLVMGSGNRNESGLSSAVANAKGGEYWTLTDREARYIEAKQAWKAAKTDPGVSETEKARLKARKQELKAEPKCPKNVKIP